MRPEDTIVALCECGCGQPAPIATFTAKRYGWEAGQPKRFVNPDHLEPVTRSVNIVRGKLGQRKLTPVAVREIRRAPASASDGELAQHFGVTPANIWHVRTRRTWKWVTDDDEA